jgi:hypothetical protein
MGHLEALLARTRSKFDEVPWNRFVGIGDSVMEGELGDPVEGYPDTGWFQQITEVFQTLKPGFVAKNVAKRYQKTSEIRETQLQPALEFEPDLVAVHTGGNDMLVEHFDVKRSEENLEAIVAPLVDRGATVFVATMYDIFKAGVMPKELHDMLEPRFRELCQVTVDVTSRCGAVLIDFASHPISADPTAYSADLQHGSRRGQGVAAEIVIDRMAEYAASTVEAA